MNEIISATPSQVPHDKMTKPVKTIDKEGTTIWELNDKRHRIDGPAIEKSNGDKEWYVNGKRHRVDGPAIEWVDGIYKSWWVNGKRHRTDGPAIEWADGRVEYYYMGKQIDEEHFLSNEFKIQIIMDE